MSMNYNNDQHDKIFLKIQYWHSYYGSNQHLSTWTKGPLSVGETIPGARHLFNYLELVRLWVLEENLLLSVY